MSEVTDTQRLIGAGRSIELIDGTTITFVFTMLSLALIEEQYGLEALQETIKGVGTKDDNGDEVKPTTGQIRTIAQFLALGLPPESAMTGDELMAKIPLSQTGKAIKVLSEAIEEAFPKEQNREQRRAAAQ